MQKGKNEKAQLYSQIFVYIITIVIVSIILVFGYRSINSFRERSDNVACFKFRDDLKNAVNSMLNDYGSVKAKEFSTCPRGNKVCFVETFKPITNIPESADPFMKDSIVDNTGENVFLIEKITKDAFFIGNISVEALDGSDVLCIAHQNNKIKLRMESKGSHVVLSRG